MIDSNECQKVATLIPYNFIQTSPIIDHLYPVLTNEREELKRDVRNRIREGEPNHFWAPLDSSILLIYVESN